MTELPSPNPLGSPEISPGITRAPFPIAGGAKPGAGVGIVDGICDGGRSGEKIGVLNETILDAAERNG